MSEFPLRCVAGLDLHKKTIVACIRERVPDKPVRVVRKTFGTFADELIALHAWLAQHGVTHVAMEGTGTLWVPVYAALESAFDLTLCNAHHVKNVPGRKTDQSDAAWLSQLLSQGLLAKSFVPSAETRAVRELTRTRVMLVEERSRTVNHLHRVLDMTGVQLGIVVTDVQGVTAQAILHALADGVTDPKALSGLARGTLRGKREALRRATEVKLRPTERYTINVWLRRIDGLDAEIEALDALIAGALAPYRAELTLLRTITGMDHVAASALLAEIGVDMSAFADAHHLASWAGMCPGQRESAGKSKGGKPRRGNAFIKRILVQVAWAMARSKHNPYAARHHSLMVRRGAKRAVFALAHQILRAVYLMLRDHVPFAPQPQSPPTPRQKKRRSDRLVAQLKGLGFEVQLREAA